MPTELYRSGFSRECREPRLQLPSQKCLQSQTLGVAHYSRPVDYHASKKCIVDMVKWLVEESRGRKNKDWGSNQAELHLLKMYERRISSEVRQPTMPYYNGSNDPRQHLLKYEWHIDEARAINDVRCKCFPIYWEGSLPHGLPGSHRSSFLLLVNWQRSS